MAIMDRSVFLAELKRFLEEEDGARNVELDGYIDSAIEICEEYLGRALDAAEHTEELYGISGDIVPRNWPVISVDLVKFNNAEQTASDFKYSKAANVIMHIVGYQHRPICTDSLFITYNAGYDGPDIPQWVLTSVTYIAAAMENMAGQGADVSVEGSGDVKKFSIPGVYSEELDVGSSSYGGVDSGDVGIIPDAARSMLDIYRDKRIA
jgi:hypothetical protein